jgi:hypothetical protein
MDTSANHIILCNVFVDFSVSIFHFWFSIVDFWFSVQYFQCCGYSSTKLLKYEL